MPSLVSSGECARFQCAVNELKMSCRRSPQQSAVTNGDAPLRTGQIYPLEIALKAGVAALLQQSVTRLQILVLFSAASQLHLASDSCGIPCISVADGEDRLSGPGANCG